MCGIIGYNGSENAIAYLLDGLETLEYRGYDSIGVAQSYENGRIEIRKTDGKIDSLKKSLAENPMEESFCGIGHTRWATHGEPSQTNAHPHRAGKTVLVHNGIIENYAEIAASLNSEYQLKSDTDTEIAACLIDRCVSDCGDIIRGTFAALSRMKGSYAFVFMNEDCPGKIFAVRQGSPLIAAENENGCFFSSDVTAIMGLCGEFYRIGEGVLAVADKDKGGFRFYGENGEVPAPEKEKISWSKEAAKKGGYPHYMLKEINEEPEVIEKTVSHCLKDGLPDFDGMLDCSVESIKIVACGSAMHAGLVGLHVIEKLAKIPVSVETASEFRYRDPVIGKNCALIFVSQSGETADTLAALRYAKKSGAKLLSIVNVPGSTLARESDNVIYTQAGPEITVATTKAYMAQCAVLYLIAAHLAKIHGHMTEDDCKNFCRKLMCGVPDSVEHVIKTDDSAKIAEKIRGKEHLFFIGRGIDWAVSTEGSLKLKEISYIHSEAYAAGELKHGTISLIEEGTPTIAVITDPALSEKTVTSLREVKSRGGETYVLSSSPEADLPIPESDPLLGMFPAVAKLQLLAYHTAILRGCDVDKPRNLAKSVTVE